MKAFSPPLDPAKIACWRTRRGCSQRTLARLLHLDEGNLSAAIHGRRRLSLERANALAAHLGVKLSGLCDLGRATLFEGCQ
jgi:transcriptional regulator with XRE-family HTH domain